MAIEDKKLTDLTEKATVGNDYLVHVVDTNDVSQSPDGSSFKAKKSALNAGSQKNTIAQIRAFTGVLANTNFYTTDLGQEGNWYYDATDTTSVDNTGTVLVTADGKRIKRVIGKDIYLKWFGSANLIQSYFTEINANYIVSSDYLLGGGTITLPINSSLSFDFGSITNGIIDFNGGLIISKSGHNAFNNVVIKNLKSGFNFNLDLFQGLLTANDSARIESGALIKSLIANNKNITILLGCHNYYFDELLLTNKKDGTNDFKIKGDRVGLFGGAQYKTTMIKPFRVGQRFILKLGGRSDFSPVSLADYDNFACSYFSLTGVMFKDCDLDNLSFKLVNPDGTGVTKKYGMLCLDNATSGNVEATFQGSSTSLYIRESWEVSLPIFNCYGSFTKDSVIYFDAVGGQNTNANCSAIFFDSIVSEQIRGALIETSTNAKVINSGAGTISCERGTSRALFSDESFNSNYSELVANIRNYKLNPLLKFYGGEFTIKELNQNTTDLGVFTDSLGVKWIDSTLDVNSAFNYSIGTIIDTHYFVIISYLNNTLSVNAHLMIGKVALWTTDDYLASNINTTGQSNAGIYIKEGNSPYQYAHTYIGTSNVPVNPDLIIGLDNTVAYSGKSLVNFFNKSKDRSLFNQYANGIMYEVFLAQNKSTDINGTALTRKFTSPDVDGTLSFKLASFGGQGVLRTDYYKNGALLFSDLSTAITNAELSYYQLKIRQCVGGNYDYAQIYVNGISNVSIPIVSCQYVSGISKILKNANVKTTIVDADEVTGTDSAVSWGMIRTTWLNVWNYIKVKSDLLYQTKLNGSGFVKISGGTVSYDNTEYNPVNSPVSIKNTSQSNFSSGLAIFKKGNVSDANGAVKNGSEIGFLKFFGFDASSDALGSYIINTATEDWSSSARGNEIVVSITPNGTTSPLQSVKFRNDRSSYFYGAVTSASTITAAQHNISSLNTTPASATASGVLGEIRYDANYMYVCVATNTWKRSALTTW